MIAGTVFFCCCQAYLDELLLKKQLDDFFEDGEQARVVHANAALEQRQQAVNELQLAVFFFEALHGLLEDQRHALLFFWGVKVELLVAHEQRALLALPAVACNAFPDYNNINNKNNLSIQSAYLLFFLFIKKKYSNHSINVGT